MACPYHVKSVSHLIICDSRVSVTLKTQALANTRSSLATSQQGLIYYPFNHTVLSFFKVSDSYHNCPFFPYLFLLSLSLSRPSSSISFLLHHHCCHLLAALSPSPPPPCCLAAIFSSLLSHCCSHLPAAA